jgi:hypothetical protein
MNGNLEVGALVALAGVATASATAIVLRHRTNPERRERERRLAISRKGRFGEGVLTDVQDDLLYYSYTVRGVQYTASQDIARLQEHLPPGDLARLIGPVTLKYSVRNPASSILVSEIWSGLRARK